MNESTPSEVYTKRAQDAKFKVLFNVADKGDRTWAGAYKGKKWKPEQLTEPKKLIFLVAIDRDIRSFWKLIDLYFTQDNDILLDKYLEKIFLTH